MKNTRLALSDLSGGTYRQIKYLAKHGAIEPLCDFLTVFSVAPRGLENILKVGEALHVPGTPIQCNPIQLSLTVEVQLRQVLAKYATPAK